MTESLLENCASPRCGSHVRARLSTITSEVSAGWPPSVSVFRRSRRARLLGACARVRLSTFALASTFGSCRRPFLRTSLGAHLRVHVRSPLAELPAAFTFSCSYPRSPFDAHGRLHSVGSQSTGSRVRVTFRRHSLRSSFENRRFTPLPSAAPVLILRRSRSRCRTTVPSRGLRRFGQRCPPSRGLNLRLCLGIQIDLHLSTLTT
jgi:hypothetical protein